jgi:hypothetical protein
MPKKGERPQNEKGRLGINQYPSHFITITHLLIYLTTLLAALQSRRTELHEVG